MDIQVIPAIIPGDVNDLSDHLSQLSEDRVIRELGEPTRVQIDIMDGNFAPTKSWPFVNDRGEFDEILEEEKGFPYWEYFDFEIDMMVEKPEQYIGEWVQAGATSLIIHSKSTNVHGDIHKTLREFQTEMGIAFRPSDDLDSALIEIADYVQLMGNDKIGYHNIDLDPKVLEMAQTIRSNYPEKDISVDIGVDGNTAGELVNAGVNKLVSGSYIFDSMDIAEAINTLKHSDE